MSRGLHTIVICAACLALGAGPAAADPLAGLDNPWLERRPLNIAHQGGEIEAPSDTLYAFKRAERLGADVMEMDVHLTADREVVALHDETVDRTTSGTGSVEDMTLAQVKLLDAAHWFVPGIGPTHDRPAGEYTLRGMATGAKRPPRRYSANDFTIPTLREMLEEFPDRLLNIELKPTQRQTGSLELEVARLLEEYGRTDDVIVVSFLDHSLELFKAIAPDVHTATATGNAAVFFASSQGPLPGAPNPRYVALQVPQVFNGVQVLSEDFIADAHANGLAVHPWTINDTAEMESLLDMGADGIMTDRPTELERIIRRRAGGPGKPKKRS